MSKPYFLITGCWTAAVVNAKATREFLEAKLNKETVSPAARQQNEEDLAKLDKFLAKVSVGSFVDLACGARVTYFPRAPRSNS